MRRSSDPLAELEAIYRRGYSSFLRVCFGIVGYVELAADAVHDGFVGAVRGRGRYRGEGTLRGLGLARGRQRGQAPAEGSAAG